ncbi:MAG TPA: transporter substrate-binding domain-containing protein [Acidimicrobiia bacterium]|nr:transporter substrate-binding domain-containing protein [Acidimicrobiia bacterium]
MKNQTIRLLALMAALALVIAACGGGGADPAEDLLAAVEDEGVLTVSTDPAYPPQSFLNDETGEYEGFDIDVATEIAERLGVEVAWEAPAWETITAGSWGGRWDLSVGSMTVTPERSEVLDFSAPYYYTPAVIAVGADDSAVSDLTTDLDGQTIAVCGACTYDFYLQGDLVIPGESFDFVIDDAQIVTTDTDSTALEQLAQGRVQAAMSSLTTIQAAIDSGMAIKIVGDPLFYEPLAAAADGSSDLSGDAFIERVSEIIDEMHSDGTLTDLSNEWFGVDLTKKTS